MRNEDFLVSPQFKLRSRKIVTERTKRQKKSDNSSELQLEFIPIDRVKVN
jgi:hypothetical protein